MAKFSELLKQLKD